MSNDLKKSILERRLIFITIFVVVMLPLIFPLGLKPEITPLVKNAFQMVETAPDSALVIISFDYDPSTITELQPMAYALIDHAWRRGHKVIAIALWPQGVGMANEAFSYVIAKHHPDKIYGTDYVNLGYKAGGTVTLQAMGRDFRNVFPQDMNETPIAQIPMLKNVKKLQDMDYVVSLSAGDPGLTAWIMVASDMYKVKTAGGTTAISAPGFLTYVNKNQQLIGLLGGLKAASEYEALLSVKGDATVSMDAQSVAHLAILVFIIIGNIKAWQKRRSQNKVRS